MANYLLLYSGGSMPESEATGSGHASLDELVWPASEAHW